MGYRGLATSLTIITVISLGPASAAGQPRSSSGAGVELNGLVVSEDASTLPRTPWGRPDLHGLWNNSTTTPLERMTAEEKARGRQAQRAVTEATGGTGAGWLELGGGLDRESLIVDPPDGRLPARTPEAEQRAEARRAVERPPFPRGPEDLGGGLRCGGGRVPMTGRGYNSNYQIVQSAGHVAILMEMMHDIRIIPLDDRPHLTSAIRTALGDARGHWEGDTLVVETTNLKRGSGGATRELRLVERFTRVAQDTLQYEYTMHDPTTWTQPWTARIFMRPAPGTGVIYEFACHEGNYALEHTLRGARLQEGR